MTIPDGPVLKFGVGQRAGGAAQEAARGSDRGRRQREAVSTRPCSTRCGGSSSRVARLPDGLVGSGTRRMLNSGQDAQPVRQITGQARIQALLVNMERWRWLPHDLGPYLRHGQHPRIHAARRRGRQGGAPDARRGRQARQADADLLRRDGGDRVQSLLERAELDQDARRSRPTCGKAAASSAADGTLRCCPAQPAHPRRERPRDRSRTRSIGAASISAITICSSRRGRTTCSAR